MADEQTFTLTLTGPQMDFIGRHAVETINAANAQAKVATELYQALRAAVQPKVPASQLTVVQNPEPEAAPAG